MHTSKSALTAVILVVLALLYFMFFPHLFSDAGSLSMDTSFPTSSPLFIRSLTLGSTGEDVKALQKFLNQDTTTRIAVSGPGSQGEETSYFGALTQAAVIRFQEKYANDVLYPLLLSRGTGYVGAKTIAKLNALSTVSATAAGGAPSDATLSSLPSSPTPSETAIPPELVQYEKYEPSSENASTMSTPVRIADFALTTQTDPYALGGAPALGDFYLAYLSQYQGLAGVHLTIFGTGFTNTNTVLIGKTGRNDIYRIDNVKAISPTTLSFSIPNDVASGVYIINVQNEHGTADNPLFFIVTAKGTMPPIIDSVSPEKVVYGNNVTVKGKNFSKKANIIFTTLGIKLDIPSPDGTTLTFPLDTIPTSSTLIPGVGDPDHDREYTLHILIMNENGISSTDNPGMVTLQI